MAWNFGDILDAISPVLPQDAPALVHGDRRITWGEMTKRSNNGFLTTRSTLSASAR